MRRARDFWLSRSNRKWRVIALVLVAWVVVLRFGIWLSASHNNNQASAAHFSATVQAELNQLHDHLEVYANTLYAGQALFNTQATITRQTWTDFITDQHLTQRYPGVYGVSYISAIQKGDAPALLAKLNSERRPGEQPLPAIYPETNSSQLAVVAYIAPDSASQSGIGYNILSDADRGAAAAAAAAAGTPSATAQLISLQGDPAGTPQSLIIFLPVYNRNLPLDTSAERQAAVEGYVAMLLHIKPVLADVFDTIEPYGQLSVSVSNGSGAIYTAGPQLHGRRQSETVAVDFAGQLWHITFAAAANYGLSSSAVWLPPLMFISGLPLLALCILVLYFAIRYQQLKDTAK